MEKGNVLQHEGAEGGSSTPLSPFQRGTRWAANGARGRVTLGGTLNHGSK